MFGVDLTKLRYGGDIISLKILANIAEIPFSYFFGHDLDWLYADFAVGCDFSRFSETNSGKPQILSSLIAQMEFPKIKLENVKMFSSFALYTEAALWFIPTDVSSTFFAATAALNSAETSFVFESKSSSSLME